MKWVLVIMVFASAPVQTDLVSTGQPPTKPTYQKSVEARWANLEDDPDVSPLPPYRFELSTERSSTQSQKWANIFAVSMLLVVTQIMIVANVCGPGRSL